MENAPGAGFSESVHDLCHATCVVVVDDRDRDRDRVALLFTTRLPSSWSVATVVRGGAGEEDADAFDDHSKVFDGAVENSRRSPWTLSSRWQLDGSRIGRSRLATQTTVFLEIFLYQMPR
uniref:Uncharacterized protein n=1 Tax=Oryza meridionalis TaxID=40149 RepID=A0A0E0CL31_9ORYZ